jgi:hypothetical protein
MIIIYIMSTGNVRSAFADSHDNQYVLMHDNQYVLMLL